MFLLYSINTNIVLVVISLKYILSQQYNIINLISRAKTFVYNKNYKSKQDRKDIAIEKYTHDKILRLTILKYILIIISIYKFEIYFV